MQDKTPITSVIAVIMAGIALILAIGVNIEAKRLIDKRLPVIWSSDSRYFPITNAGDAKIHIYFDGKEYGPFVIHAGMTRVFTFDSDCAENEETE